MKIFIREKSNIKNMVAAIKSSEIILIIFFFVFTLLISSYLYFGAQPALFGDGGEYLGMTCSFFNHLSPDLTSDDIALRHDIIVKNKGYYPDTLNYRGYYKSINDQWYSYHLKSRTFITITKNLISI